MVRKKVGQLSPLSDDYLFLFRLYLHSLLQLNSFNSALASFRSAVSNPSVNQL